MLPFRLCLFVVGTLLYASSQAGVYRWVDENGVTVYSQVPPPVHIEKQQVDVPPPPKVTEEEAWKGINQEWRDMRDRQDITKEQAIADSDKEKRSKDEEHNCAVARSTIETLADRNNRRMRTPDGKTRRISAQEREERLSEARAMEEKYCD